MANQQFLNQRNSERLEDLTPKQFRQRFPNVVISELNSRGRRSILIPGKTKNDAPESIGYAKLDFDPSEPFRFILMVDRSAKEPRKLWVIVNNRKMDTMATKDIFGDIDAELADEVAAENAATVRQSEGAGAAKTK